MKRPINKFIAIVFTAFSISACNRVSSSFVSNSASSSKKENSSYSTSNSSTPASSSSNKSSSNSKSSKSSSSVSIELPSSSVSHNPHDCDNHVLEETILKKATLLEKGIKNYKCPNCGADFNDYYYDLDEFVFDDMTFMYDGNEHEILIDGLLPYGTRVVYENNTLTDIDTKEATAKIYDENDNLLVEKKANISIVENIGIPNIKIFTEDGEDPNWKTNKETHDRDYKNMTLFVDNCESRYVINEASGQMKVRGNSTNQEAVAKRAFRLKMNSKINLLGLNDGIREKSWVLLADFFDQSMFRNAAAFSMGNALFNYSGYYSSDYKHVNLYMNDDYRGVYLLAEQQQAKSKRIPVNEPSNETVTTKNVGYLVEIDGLVSQNARDGYLETDPCFASSSAGKVNGISISSKGYVIKTDAFSDEQKDFIKKYVNNTTKAFANTCNGTYNIVDENADIQDSPYDNMFDTLNSFLDLDSFFRMYLLQEFMKDYDVGWGSFYMYVDFSDNATVTRLTMGAPWDFDLAEGNKTSGGGWGMGGNISSATDSYLNNKSYANGMTTFNPWLWMLSNTDFFNDMFKKYYSIFDKSGVYTKTSDFINYEKVAFASAFNDTYTRYGLPNASGSTLMQTRQYNKHEDAVSYLTTWLQNRKDYLDTTWLN